MIDIVEYANTGMIRSLCVEIEMPPEVTEQIVYHAGHMDLPGLAPFLDKMFSMETAVEAQKALHEYCGDAHSGLDELAFFLAAALHTREIYAAKGINDGVYVDTMKMFTRFVNEHMASFGKYGFDRGYWVTRIISAVLFRLGELEFEMRVLTEEVPGYGMPGDPVLSVHIPSNARLTRENLDRTYDMARRFFAEYFGDFKYKYIYTGTWLLSPALKDLLPPGSKILEFQSDYTITAYNEDSNSFMTWVYKRKYDDYNLLPETTTLTRNIKRHLLNGGKIGSAHGVLNMKW